MEPVPPPTQTPPDVKIRVLAGVTDLIRVIGNGARDIGVFRTNVEYWNHAALPSEGPPDALTLKSEAYASDETEGTLTRFLEPTSVRAFEAIRTPVSWKEGAYTVRSGYSGYLYSMEDPDVRDAPAIGVLLEVDGESLLRRAVFYRSELREDGLVWGATGIDAASLARVKDADGRFTTSPAFLDGRGAWNGHYTIMGA